MSGLLTRPDGTKYIFRYHDGEWWAWDIHSNPCRGMSHKWGKLPKGYVTKFDIDNPPKTVSYQPILGRFT